MSHERCYYFAIERDDIGGAHNGPLLGRLAVDGDTTGCNRSIGCSAAERSTTGDVFVESHALIVH